MKRIITVLALAISLCSVANAQMDVAGISVYSHPTRSQVESKLGKPLSYKEDKSNYIYDEKDEKVYVTNEIYKYEDLKIEVSTDCGLDYFELYSKEYPILTNRISAAGVRVGQKASILTQQYHMKGEKALSFSTDYSRKIGADWYYYNDIVNPFDDTFLVLIKDGIIYGFIFNVRAV